MIDKIVEANIALLRRRSDIGIKKYGTTLADNKSVEEDDIYWLRHALEEALDLANYLQAEIQRREDKWEINK